MLKKQDIKLIETGHRQMTFGFGDNLQDEKRINSCVIEQIETHGYAILDEIVADIKTMHSIDEVTILQNIFWYALELKIHLRADNQNISPKQAKKNLLKTPDKPVKIIANKSVPDLIFLEMSRFYNKLLNLQKPVEFRSQYELSRYFFRELERWENGLKSFKALSKKKYYPGAKRVDFCLVSISKILEKLDSYSLIVSCCKNQDIIIEMAKEIPVLLKFYSRHAKFWGKLIKSIKKFEQNLKEIEQNPEIFSSFNTIIGIVALPEPYDEIIKVKEQFKIVKKYNDFIELEKLKKYKDKLILQLDLMIGKLNMLFKKNNSDPDFRNTSLYELRKLRIKLEHARSIKKTDTVFAYSKDLYDDIVEEL